MMMSTMCLSSALVTTSTYAAANNGNVTDKQLSNPTEMTQIEVEEGHTEIVMASWRDLNMIHTPFKNPKIIKDTDVSMTVDGQSIYFRAGEHAPPFGMYITERDDSNAPKIKLNVISTDLPVGQQIKLVIDGDALWNGSSAGIGGDSHLTSESYPEEVIEIFTAIGKSYPNGTPPAGFKMKDNLGGDPKFYGNTLLLLERRYRNGAYIVDVYSATNRANETIELNASDFLVEGTPEDGTTKDAANNAVAFYPNKVLQPGQTTNVFVMRARR
jgi:hypothetical protein